MDHVFRDTVVADAFVQDKLQREGAHCLLKTLYAQGSDIVKGGLSACVPPESLYISAFDSQHERAWNEGRLYVTLDGSKVAVISGSMLTVDGFKKQLKFINNTLDRCPTNSCMLNFCIFAQNICITANWGRFHDIWNSVKNAAKKKLLLQDGSGRVVCLWTSVVRFSSIANINHGPFRSGCWGRGKQATVKRIEGSMSGRSAAVREVISAQCRLLGTPEPTADEGFEEMFRDKVLLAPSAHEAGSILKFARWKSVSDNWDLHRPQIWYEKLILTEMGSSGGADMMAFVAASSTSMHDTEIAQKMTSSKTGLLARAPTYITQDVCLHLNRFCCVTRPLSKWHGYRAAEVRTKS